MCLTLRKARSSLKTSTTPLLPGVVQEPPPGGAVGDVVGRGPVDVLAVDRPALGPDEIPQGDQLGVGILVPVKMDTRA